MGIGLERVDESIGLSDVWGARALGLDEEACAGIRETLRTVLEEEKKLYGV
jgi:hypothetical protein